MARTHIAFLLEGKLALEGLRTNPQTGGRAAQLVLSISSYVSLHMIFQAGKQKPSEMHAGAILLLVNQNLVASIRFN